jgi:hypothetical protein
MANIFSNFFGGITIVKLPEPPEQKEFNVLACKTILALAMFLTSVFVWEDYRSMGTVVQIEAKVQADYAGWYNNIIANYTCSKKDLEGGCIVSGFYVKNCSFNKLGVPLI